MNDFFMGVAKLGETALSAYNASETRAYNQRIADIAASRDVSIAQAQANSKKLIYVGVLLIAGAVLLKITKVI